MGQSEGRRPLTALLILAALLATVFPTVLFGDDGELTRAVWTVGIAHPPGFPNYIMTAKPMTLIPFGSIAFRVHLGSVLAAAAAAAAIFLLARSWGACPWGSWVGALAALTTPVFWQQARLARTYPFLAILTVLFLWGLGKFLETGRKDQRWAFFMVTVSSLGLGFHQLMVVPLAAGLIIISIEAVRGKLAAAIFPCFVLAGGLPFAALPLRTLKTPPAIWGAPHDWNSLINHIFQREYAAKMAPELSRVSSLIKIMAAAFVRELSLPVLALAVLGLIILFRRKPVAALTAVFITAGTVALRSFYFGAGEIGPDSYRVVTRYLLGVFAVGGALAAVGWHSLFKLLSRGVEARHHRWLETGAAIVAAAIFLLRAFASSFPMPVHLWHDQARGALLSSPVKSLLLTGGDDILFPLWYLQDLGEYAPDRVIMSEAGFGRHWYLNQIADRAEKHLGIPDREFLISSSVEDLFHRIQPYEGIKVGTTFSPPGASSKMKPFHPLNEGGWLAYGLGFRFLERQESFFLDRYLGEGISIWQMIPIHPPLFSPPPEAQLVLRRITYFMTVAARGAIHSNRPSAALALLIRAADLDPTDPVVHNETGIVLAGLGLHSQAVESFRKALKNKPEDAAIAENLAREEAVAAESSPFDQEEQP